jgi:hypothetical protein
MEDIENALPDIPQLMSQANVEVPANAYMDEEQRQRIFAARGAGRTIRQIAKDEGINYNKVYYVLKRRSAVAGLVKQGIHKEKIPKELTTSQVIKMAMDRLGGVHFLEEWARKHPTEFITKVWVRLLPLKVNQDTNVKVTGDVFQRIEQLTVEYRTEMARGAAGNCIGQRLDSEAPPAAEHQAVDVSDGNAG